HLSSFSSCDSTHSFACPVFLFVYPMIPRPPISPLFPYTTLFRSPSSMWFDAEGNRFPAPNYPGFDTNRTMAAILRTGYDYSWFVLNESIIRKEFALSGSEQNPNLTEKDIRITLDRLRSSDAPAPIDAFKDYGPDFVVAETTEDLVTGMNERSRGPVIDHDRLICQIRQRDRQTDHAFSKAAQVPAIHNARAYP